MSHPSPYDTYKKNKTNKTNDNIVGCNIVLNGSNRYDDSTHFISNTPYYEYCSNIEYDRHIKDLLLYKSNMAHDHIPL